MKLFLIKCTLNLGLCKFNVHLFNKTKRAIKPETKSKKKWRLQ